MTEKIEIPETEMKIHKYFFLEFKIGLTKKSGKREKIHRIAGPFFSKIFQKWSSLFFSYKVRHVFWNIMALIFHLAISQHLSAVARLHFEISSNVENEKFQFDFLIHSFTKLLSFIL